MRGEKKKKRVHFLTVLHRVVFYLITLYTPLFLTQLFLGFEQGLCPSQEYLENNLFLRVSETLSTSNHMKCWHLYIKPFVIYTRWTGEGANVLNKKQKKILSALEGNFEQTLDSWKVYVHLYKRQFYWKHSAQRAGGD